MNNPNIVFTAPRVAEVLDQPLPVAGPGAALVRTVRSCISSGTERANLIGDTSLSPGRPEMAAEFPRRLGYSLCGVVEAVGEGVKGLQPGDRVAASWTKHAAFNVVSERQLYRVPEGVPEEWAAWTHIATFPMAALRKCRFEFGESVLVMVMGVLGQLAVSRFASAMSMATASGLSMDESVELAAKLCGGAKEIDEKTAKCRADIENGESPADALSSCGLFSSRDCRLIKLSERTGSLPDTLEDLAARQEEESLRRIDRAVGAIEPAIVVLTSALAGIILLSVMLPLMGLLSGM